MGLLVGGESVGTGLGMVGLGVLTGDAVEEMGNRGGGAGAAWKGEGSKGGKRVGDEFWAKGRGGVGKIPRDVGQANGSGGRVMETGSG